MKPAFLSFALLALTSWQATAQGAYEYRKGDPNGIGKWYMGRQIAHVMSHYGIPWLERTERQSEEDTEQLIRNLGLRKGMNVADIGAGSGYHAVRMSKLIGSGKVYAVDIEPEMIRFMEERIAREGIGNIETVLGRTEKLPLPANSMDRILLVDVYHEFSHPYEMGRSMLEALKPEGKLYLVEFRVEDRDVPIKEVHKMSQAQAVKELTAAGFTFERNIGNLPWQHCLVFKK
jgi:ubiquinone/menaquinone biosynthesis C-methylase UbiE